MAFQASLSHHLQIPSSAGGWTESASGHGEGLVAQPWSQRAYLQGCEQECSECGGEGGTRGMEDFSSKTTFEGVEGMGGSMAGLGNSEKPSMVETLGVRQFEGGASVYPLEYSLPFGMATAAK